MVIPLRKWPANGIRVWVPDSSDDIIKKALDNSRERVALDLHIGGAFQRDHSWIEMPSRLVLRPNECIRLKVHELIETSGEVFGQICSRASLTAQGLIVSNIKVDPNFVGYLEVAVFNAGKSPIALERGSSFASVWFARLKPTLNDEEAPKRVPTPTAGIAFSNWRERSRAVAPFAVTAVVSIGGSVIAGLIFKVF